MRRLSPVALLTCLSLFGATPAFASGCAPAPEGIVSWWTIGHGGNDAIGSNDGISFGEADAGLVGRVLFGAIQVPSSSSLSFPGSFSIEGWIYPYDDVTSQILGKWGDAGSWVNQREYSFQTLTGRGLRFAISDDAHQQDDSFHNFDVPGVLTRVVWNHVAAVYDQTTGTRSMYVNGKLVAARIDPPISLTQGSADLGIGALIREGGVAALNFSGLSDEFAVYSRALAASEIAAIYTAGGLGKCLEACKCLDLYVDDDAPDDPGAGDANVSDPLEDGSPAHPFDRIQEALDVTQLGSVVHVASGVYEESAEVPSVDLTIRGQGAGSTVVHGGLTAPRDWSVYVISAWAVKDIRLVGGSLTSWGMFDVDVSASSLIDSSIDVSLPGTCSGGSLSLRDVTATGGSIHASSGCGMTVTAEGLDAPNTAVDMSANDAFLEVRIAKSTLASLGLSGVAGSSLGLNLTLDDVRLGGATLFARGSPYLISLSRCQFGRGGLVFYDYTDIQSPESSYFEVTESRFVLGALDYFSESSLARRARFEGNIFEESGLRYRLARGPEVLLEVKNNVFQRSGVETEISYYDPNAPLGGNVTVDSRIINNTFVDADTAVRIRTLPHVTGSDSYQTAIVNNIVATGGRGVWIDGTGDQVLTIHNNDVFENEVADWIGIPNPTNLNGNITSNPRFFRPFSGDYRLKRNSPCVDSGQGGPFTPATDHDGVARPQDGDGDGIALPDIGAFERSAPHKVRLTSSPRDKGKSQPYSVRTESACPARTCP